MKYETAIELGLRFRHFNVYEDHVTIFYSDGDRLGDVNF